MEFSVGKFTKKQINRWDSSVSQPIGHAHGFSDECKRCTMSGLESETRTESTTPASCGAFHRKCTVLEDNGLYSQQRFHTGRPCMIYLLGVPTIHLQHSTRLLFQDKLICTFSTGRTLNPFVSDTAHTKLQQGRRARDGVRKPARSGYKMRALRVSRFNPAHAALRRRAA